MVRGVGEGSSSVMADASSSSGSALSLSIVVKVVVPLQPPMSGDLVGVGSTNNIFIHISVNLYYRNPINKMCIQE